MATFLEEGLSLESSKTPAIFPVFLFLILSDKTSSSDEILMATIPISPDEKVEVCILINLLVE